MHEFGAAQFRGRQSSASSVGRIRFIKEQIRSRRRADGAGCGAQILQHGAGSLVGAVPAEMRFNEVCRSLRQFKRVSCWVRQLCRRRGIVLRQIGPEEVGLKEDREFAGEALLPAKLPSGFAQMRRDG